jgi:hypothetical protein
VLRDLAVEDPETWRRLILIYQYWIALTDCEGLRIDAEARRRRGRLLSPCAGRASMETQAGHDTLMARRGWSKHTARIQVNDPACGAGGQSSRATA